MKPILIDAIYINMGGALTVLNRLIDGVVNANLDVVLLKDARCPRLNNEERIGKIVVLEPSLKARHRYYKEHRNDYHSVLCMSNVPPTIKMPCPVHTYFHNLSVLMNQKSMDWKRRLKNWTKRQTISFFSRNTNSWVVQTSNTEQLVKHHLPSKGKTFYQFPIYSIPEELYIREECARDGYLFVGEYTFAKGHDNLLEAWKILHERGFDCPLHLTSRYKPFVEKIESLKRGGVNIINHGFVPFREMPSIYKQSKVIVYPSFNESLGLGIVEGIIAGCDVIASDLPFTHAICKPSGVFDPYIPQSIADAVVSYETQEHKHSELTIHDCMNELLELLIK